VACRRNAALEGKVVNDKRNNRLITVAGSSGSGKSAFLVHLPEAAAFRECFLNPIVAALTFNQQMSGEDDAFGVRIFYAAMKGMHGIGMSFEEVLETFSHEYTVRHTVAVLWELFGYRPIIVLIDELAKATNPGKIAKDVGYLLDLYEDVHVVISALEPSFVSSLMSGREVDYIVPEPLFDATLAATTCRNYAQQFREQPVLTTILQNAHLLASGHPLTIARLDSELPNYRYAELKSLMAAPAAFPLIQFLCEAIGRFTPLVPTPEEFEMMLCCRPIPYLRTEEGALFCGALERNAAFVGRREGFERSWLQHHLQRFGSICPSLRALCLAQR